MPDLPDFLLELWQDPAELLVECSSNVLCKLFLAVVVVSSVMVVVVELAASLIDSAVAAVSGRQPAGPLPVERE